LASSSIKEKSSSLILGSDGNQPKDAAGSSKWKSLQAQIPTRATKARSEGEPEKSIPTPLNVPFLKQIDKNAVAIYTVEPREDVSAGL
jgi:hypothetical protein